jgi:hypothetical protein
MYISLLAEFCMFSCISAGKKRGYGFQMTGLNMWDVSFLKLQPLTQSHKAHMALHVHFKEKYTLFTETCSHQVAQPKFDPWLESYTREPQFNRLAKSFLPKLCEMIFTFSCFVGSYEASRPKTSG